MKKKITIFALHLNYGGIEKYISLLCKMFEKDFDIDIIATYKYSDNPAFNFNKNIKIVYLTNDYPDRVSLKKLLKDKKVIQMALEIFRRKKLNYLARKSNIKAIRNLKTDYVITTRIYHNELISKYCINQNIVKIATEHNYHNDNLKYINKFIASVTNFDYVVHCTKELYDFYSNKLINMKNVLIENPIYIDDKDISKLNNKNIISVGRLSCEKGYLDLIDVMKKIVSIDNNINLTICGDGYERKLIEDKIKQYSLEKNIKLTGFINEKELKKEYISSSIYVMPSKSEAFGLVLLEAMHYGLPCISFDSASGARNLLNDGTGILIENRDVIKMSKRIVELINNKEELLKYQKKSMKKVANYSLENIYIKWQKILK